MDGLLLALVLAFALEQGSSTQTRAASDNDAGSVAGILVAVIAVSVAAAGFGSGIAPLLVPEAALLFLAIALAFGAAGLIITALRARREPAPPRTAQGAAGFAYLLLRRLGDNGAFAVAAVAIFSHAPVLTAIGGMLGSLAGLGPAWLLGRAWVGAPLQRGLCGLLGALLLPAALSTAASALRVTA